ncbi:phospholipid-transporting ATPase ABCA1-like isoform X5 [Lethenteron reissneri]|nr:phospholipid-transporting ATPase ABCA1-like isoform X5 [Lethenteron reissneri]XP_061418253.1 phospholipid-transporting ATPase ABCA1-like isoform X5 [Lethenteron reissneri]
MGFWTQLYLLLWKNFTLLRRQKLRLLMEVLWPLMIFFILISVRSSYPPHEQHECHFPNKAMPSAGLVPWLQSLVCNMNNPCFRHATPGEAPGTVSNFENSLLSRLFEELQEGFVNLTQKGSVEELRGYERLLSLIKDRDVRRILPVVRVRDMLTDEEGLSFFARQDNLFSEAVIAQLLEAHIHPGQVLANLTAAGMRAGVCDPELLSHALVLPDPAVQPEAQRQLCNLTETQTRGLLTAFVARLDRSKLMQVMMPGVDPKTLDVVGTMVGNLQTVTRLMKETFEELQDDSDGGSSAPNGTMGLMRGFRSVSRLVCGYPEEGLITIRSMNPYEENNFKSFLSSNMSEEKAYVYDNSTTAYCNNMIQRMESNLATRFMWNTVKPLFMGKILFSPNTPAVQRIVREANDTFVKMGMLGNVFEAWRAVKPQLWEFMQNSQEINGLKDLLRTPEVASVLDAALNGTGWSVDSLLSFLSAQVGGMPGIATHLLQQNWQVLLNDTDAVLETATQFLECMNLDKFEGQPDEEQLVSRALELLDENEFWAGIVFMDLDPNSEELPAHVRYKIRMDIDSVQRTNKIKDRYWDPGPRADPFDDLRYIWGGFAYLQDSVEQGIIRAQTNGSLSVGVYVQQMPYPCYVDDIFLRIMNRSLPMFLTLAWIYSVAMILKEVVHEKEARLKETMRIMGLSTSMLWLSWFISILIPLLISAVLLTVLLKMGNILYYSDPTIVYLYLCVFAIATVMQCFLISTLFSRANLAAATGGIVYFSFYLPYVLCVAWQNQISYSVKISTSIFSTVAFSFGSEFFSLYEEQGVGMQWENVFSSPVEGEDYTFISSIFMMLFDAFIYGLLTVYIENVFPGQYGVPKPWYFPCTRAYWRGDTMEKELYETIAQKQPQVDNIFVEDEPGDLPVGVSIQGLVKIYNAGKKLAVDGLSLNFYQGQITSFLGHNGAGKTTTMSILTGLFPPTAGTAYILGRDIRTDIDKIRKNLGVCPQYNVLFDQLTVEEHIWFYARLKGRSEQEAKQEIEQMIQDVDLAHKRSDISKSLSGGMQRKLSIGIAFVGGSKVVFLDEPTAGVDPYARRGIWNLLLKYRHGRTIILSTHHMDEADLLGDRIAIISHGRLRCCGSSLFLKNAFGAGYYLTMVKRSGSGGSNSSCLAGLARFEADSSFTERTRSLLMQVWHGRQAPDDDRHSASSSDEGFGSDESNPDSIADVSSVTRLLQQHLPDARLIENFGQELTYLLPSHGAKDGSFALLFKELDEKLAELGVSSYGVSDTTLEEIFLKVAEEPATNSHANNGEIPRKRHRRIRFSGCHLTTHAEPEVDMELAERNVFQGYRIPELWKKAELGELEKLNELDGKGTQQISGIQLILLQFKALFIKRFHHARRSRKGFVAQIILPAVFVCLALVFSLIIPPFGKYPMLQLQPWMYGEQYTFLSNDAPENVKTNSLYDALLNKPGFGTRCMNGESIPNAACMETKSEWVQPPMSPAMAQTLQSRNWSMEEPSPECRCSGEGRRVILPDCPEGAGGPPPMQRVQNTTDTLEDLSGRNISDYLVKTYPQAIRKSLKHKYWVNEIRYGGLSVGKKKLSNSASPKDMDIVFTNVKRVFHIENKAVDVLYSGVKDMVSFLGPKETIKVWFNNKGWHAIVAFMNMANNAVLRSSLPAGTDPSDYGITAYNHPLNLTKEQLSEVMLLTTSVDVLVSICVIFAMSFVPASFVLFLIQERVSKAKHLQFVSGVNPTIYWISNFAWDMLNYTVPATLVVLIFLCFQQQSYTSAANLPVLITLLLLYGWSITPLMYPASFIFRVPSTAYVVLTCLNLFIGINGSIATFILELFEDDQNLKRINSVLKQIFLIFPHFCLGRGLMDMVKNQAMSDAFQRFGENRFVDPFSWDMVGKNLFAMAVEGMGFFIINLLVQYRFFCKPRSHRGKLQPVSEEDEDVARERTRLTNDEGGSDTLVIRNLTKVYNGKKKPAVDRICVGIPPGECFGLLGVNGAGKTTTFKMLTGDTDITSGDALLNRYSILTHKREVHQNMGYCPQFDAINDLITGREHLEFYARLRGVPEKEVSRVAAWGIRKLGLTKYADRAAGNYSGGNKRKLSTAIALVGCPPIVFLDEPTTGMDPKARRFLWDCILSIIKEGRCVLLTSHSMEECEALCTRMSIMVNGRFQCLGSVQHLKNKFGDGYTVTLRVAGSPPVLPPVEEFIDSAFPGSLLKERHHNMLQYQLPSAESSLAKIFNLLALRKEELNVEDYSVSQTTLDQVFINFAKHQSDEDHNSIIQTSVV